jgi:hypothetical protein
MKRSGTIVVEFLRSETLILCKQSCDHEQGDNKLYIANNVKHNFGQLNMGYKEN